MTHAPSAGPTLPARPKSHGPRYVLPTDTYADRLALVESLADWAKRFGQAEPDPAFDDFGDAMESGRTALPIIHRSGVVPNHNDISERMSAAERRRNGL